MIKYMLGHIQLEKPVSILDTFKKTLIFVYLT